jgi:hypothetical protein
VCTLRQESKQVAQSEKLRAMRDKIKKNMSQKRKKKIIKYEIEIVCFTDFMETLMCSFVDNFIFATEIFLKSKNSTCSITSKKLDEHEHAKH